MNAQAVTQDTVSGQQHSKHLSNPYKSTKIKILALQKTTNIKIFWCCFSVRPKPVGRNYLKWPWKCLLRESSCTTVCQTRWSITFPYTGELHTPSLTFNCLLNIHLLCCWTTLDYERIGLRMLPLLRNECVWPTVKLIYSAIQCFTIHTHFQVSH